MASRLKKVLELKGSYKSCKRATASNADADTGQPPPIGPVRYSTTGAHVGIPTDNAALEITRKKTNVFDAEVMIAKLYEAQRSKEQDLSSGNFSEFHDSLASVQSRKLTINHFLNAFEDSSRNNREKSVLKGRQNPRSRSILTRYFGAAGSSGTEQTQDRGRWKRRFKNGFNQRWRRCMRFMCCIGRRTQSQKI